MKKIAIIGGGPAGLFMFKKLIAAGSSDYNIDVFEKSNYLGAGMPYSTAGANKEHITNVSANEIPDLELSLSDWLATLPDAELKKYGIDVNHFSEYRVVPRLLFGKYLNAQFEILKERAKKNGLKCSVYLGYKVADIRKLDGGNEMQLQIDKRSLEEALLYDVVIICTGHFWPKRWEGKVAGYFDSPYPPAKLVLKINDAIGLKGGALTAIDALRTLARNNGRFFKVEERLHFKPYEDCPNFKITMHSRSGMLPAVRFHLEDPHLAAFAAFTDEEIAHYRKLNNGFVPLDIVFEENFKVLLKERDPQFYNNIKDFTMEQFVDAMLWRRENMDAFALMAAEYQEAAVSIERQSSVVWKELIAILSISLNHPAKYFSAEDTLRMQQSLMPLIAIVIAFVPQRSVEEMLALHAAGVLSLINVGDGGKETPTDLGTLLQYKDERGVEKEVLYKYYIDCTGQPQLSFEDFPFTNLKEKGIVRPAIVAFRDANFAHALKKEGNENVIAQKDGSFWLKVPGVAINDNFQPINKANETTENLFIMAVSHIGGFYPDYSGLDFCDTASDLIAAEILKESDARRD